MARPRLLDLFCGAGGCSVGYHRAGFDVTGVDIEPHADYPYELIVADAMDVLSDTGFLAGFDAFHASPPCQFATQMSARWRGKGTKADEHQDLLTPTLQRLRGMATPWVVENVPGARRLMREPLVLHGGMFGLGVHRPRLFESNVLLFSFKAPATKNPLGVYGKPDGRTTWRYRNNGNYKGKSLIRAWKSLEEGSAAMGIDWMNVDDLREAIPPAYTEFIGAQLLDQLHNAPAPVESRPTPTRSAPLLAPERHAKGRPIHGRPVAESLAGSASRGPGDVVLGGQDPLAIGEQDLEQLAVAGVVADVAGAGEGLAVVVECDGVAGAVGGEGACCLRHVSSMAGVDTPCQYTRRDSLPESARAGP